MPTARLRGSEVFYALHGSGPPLLCMHGGMGLDHTYLRPWLDPLGEQTTLIYYDHRGNGRSTHEGPFDAVTHGTWADDADALRAALGHDRIVVLGHSYGSFLALEYAVRHPDRLAGLVLIGSTPRFDYPDVVMANAGKRATPDQLAALNSALGTPAKDDADFARSFRSIAQLYFHRPDPPLLERVLRNVRFSAAASNAAMFRCLPSYDVTAHLGEIRSPTLVLSGRDDWITPPEQGARLERAIAGAKLVVFEESGHFPFIEEQGRFIEVVSTWLGEHGLAKRASRPGSETVA